MDAIISKLLEELNSSVFILLGMFLVLCFAIHKVSMYLGIWKERFFTYDKRLDKFDSMHDTLVALKERVDVIYENTVKNKLYESHSPVSLTAFGKEIASKVNAYAILDRCYPVLDKHMLEKCPLGTSAYDIQKESSAIIEKTLPPLLLSSEINVMKQVAFENGFPMEDIWSVFSIIFRDHTLETRGLSNN